MNQKDFESFLQHCRIVEKLNDGKILLEIEQTSEYIVMKTVTPHADISILNETLSNQKGLFHEHLLTVLDYCCVSGSEIQILMEYCTHSMKE